MNADSKVLTDSPRDHRLAEAETVSATRPFYWSLRRELWENRSIYVAPLFVAALALFGFLISTRGLADRMRALSTLDPVEQLHAVVMPYSLVASLILVTGWIVGLFSCLDAL